MGRLQTWDDQVRTERSKPAPVQVPTDPAVMALLERIALASERTMRRVAIIAVLVWAGPFAVLVLALGMWLTYR